MTHYLIIFCVDDELLKEKYPTDNWNNAYYDIRQVLKKYRFNNIQGSVYEGESGVSEAHGTIAIQELTLRFNWFNVCVSNIRFLRIEDDLNAQFISDQMQSAINSANLKRCKLIQKYQSMNLTQEQINELLADPDTEIVLPVRNIIQPLDSYS